MFKKDYIFLILLLALILGAFLWKNPELGSKLGSKLAFNLFSSPELNLTEDTGLEIEEVGQDLSVRPEKQEEDEIVILTEPNILEPQLGQIYQEVNQLSQEVAEIEKQVKDLIALTEIQKEIDTIAQKINKIQTELG